MMIIKPINIFAYLFSFAEILPGLTGYYAQKAVSSFKGGGLILGAFIDGVPAGAAVAGIQETDAGKRFMISYIAVAEKYRRQGICKALINECLDYAKKSGCKYTRCNYTLQEPCGEALENYLLRRGFAKTSSTETLTIHVTGRNRLEWAEFSDKRGLRILAKLKDKGYCAESLHEVSPEVLERLYAGMGTKFPEYLDPRNCSDEIMERYSFVTVSDGNPVAYCIVATPDHGQSAVVQYMASSIDHINRGVFFLCLAASIGSIAEDKKCLRVAYTVYDGNTKMQRMTKSFLNFTDMTVKEQGIYEYGEEMQI